MSTELTHILIPARSRWASAAFLASNLDVPDHHIRLILGLDSPDSGTVTVRGRPHRHSPTPMRDVGALPEARVVHGDRGGLPDGRLADASPMSPSAASSATSSSATSPRRPAPVLAGRG